MNRQYTQKTLGLLWGKSGGICAYPNCENELIINTIDEIVGHICHIVGLEGSRADSSFPRKKLNEYENLVLMCRHHHGIVDIDIQANTIEKLTKIKTDHEKQMLERYKKGIPWEINVSQLYYLNIPRLSILGEFNGSSFDFDFLKDYKDLHSIGFALAGLLGKFKSLFSQLKPRIIEESSIKEIDNNLLGLTFSFNGSFRTKNNPRLDDYVEGKFKLKGSIDKDPQLYKQFLDFKLILTIDPRWLATTTAFVNFRPSSGRGIFAGIATIKQIDYESKLILATPLLIGIPKSPLDTLFQNNHGKLV
jgi:hypothetical protein